MTTISFVILLECKPVIPSSLQPGDLATWTLVLLTAIYVVITALLWRSSLKNQRDFVALNNPCVMTSLIQIGWTEGIALLSISLKNYGNSIAKNISVPLKLSRDGVVFQEYGNLGVDFIIPPHTEKHFSLELTDARLFLEGVANGNIPLFVHFDVYFEGMNDEKFVYEDLSEYKHDLKIFIIKSSTILKVTKREG